MGYNRSNCIVNNLSLEAGKRLMELRRQVSIAFKEEPGPDLGFEVVEPKIKYLEAYQRYSGHLYSGISENSWNKLSRSPRLKLIIVSALYGLANYNEPIRYYNRTMKDQIYPGKLLKTWWNDQRLPEILFDFVIQNKIEVVHDFLSTDYAHATWNFSSRLEEIGVHYLPHAYPGLGSGSDYRRGREVEELIRGF